MNSTICFANSIPFSVDSASKNARTGESFSRVRTSLGPTCLHSAARITVFAGTSNPACSANHVASLPTTSGFNTASAKFLSVEATPNMNFSNFFLLVALRKCTPYFVNLSQTSL